MFLSALLSALHLLALAIGLGGVFMRARYLRASVLDDAGVRRVLIADNFWGIAALLWLVTGLCRAFAGFEKGTAYYLHNALFHTKLTLFVLVVLLEIWPMATLIRWRIARGRQTAPDTRKARFFAIISDIESLCLIIMVFLASFMARGFGLF